MISRIEWYYKGRIWWLLIRERMNFMLVRCPECSSLFRAKEHVVIDEANGLIHSRCLNDKNMLLDVKDSGTFIQIKKLYPYFGPTADLKLIK